MSSQDPLGARASLQTGSGLVEYFSLPKLAAQGISQIERLPFSIKVLVENLLRHAGNGIVGEQDVIELAKWNPKHPGQREVPFMPARVVLQDFTGVPSIVDLAAMRSAMVRMKGDPKKINPLVPVDLVIDHSVQVDSFASPDSLGINEDIEFARNMERYEFLRWGQRAFANFRVVPPATGIVHQVNLEYLAKVVMVSVAPPLVGGAVRGSSPTRGDATGGPRVAFPDTLVGTDSHTTMINGLGVLGWGVGGIEAEAVMLGQPIYMLAPEVIGFKLCGRLPEGATATDLVLTVTQLLRARGVVEKFVEFFGDGLSELSLPDRATIANMAPEYGATVGYFPIDDETLRYLERTGRTADEVDLVDRYAKEQGLFRRDGMSDPAFTDVMYLELGTVEPSLAGPKRPQDRIRLSEVKSSFLKSLTAPVKDRGFGLTPSDVDRTVTVSVATADQSPDRTGGVPREIGGPANEVGPLPHGRGSVLGHGAVVIAAITSCTNTSNPSVMVGAGLLAKKAVERGLKVKPHVKTSLAPGSRVVTDYLNKAGLTQHLEKLGFHTVGYGCTTCIGNSGPVPEPVAKAVTEGNLVAAAVLSGNRNFEGRINPLVKANYLASPPLVVAYALAGRADINFDTEPLGTDPAGKNVFLRDIWPKQGEIMEAVSQSLTPDMFRKQYGNVFDGNEKWNRIPVAGGDLYQWNDRSTYIQEPPFFVDLKREPGPIHPIENARVLVMVGDSVTTDHISPAGSIKPDSPAGKYLQSLGVTPKDFNSYGSRRGNDRVMTRGTFANIRLRNLLAPGTEGCVTRYLPTGGQMSVYDAAMMYRESRTPLLVIAGAEYGTGSSRDWAAKGAFLLGIRAVIAVSFERIHRSNLVGMGVLPLQFKKGETRESLGMSGEEVFSIQGLSDALTPQQEVTVIAKDANGPEKRFSPTVRIDTPVEIEYYRNGGILQTVLRNMLKS